MTSRERILSAINHKQPDRIPVDLGAHGSSGMSFVAYQNLLRYLGMEHLPNQDEYKLAADHIRSIGQKAGLSFS